MYFTYDLDMPFIPLSTTSFPFLSLQDKNQIFFNYGSLYQVMISSSMLRFNADQIQYSHGRLQLSDKWAKLPCSPQQNSFCFVNCTDDANTCNANTTLTVFATDKVDVPAFLDELQVPDNFKPFLYSCDGDTTRRQIKFGDNNYEISLCDLSDGSLEFVYDTAKNMIYFKQSKQSIFVVIGLVLLTLFFFIKTCDHLSMIIRSQKIRFAHSTTTLPIVIACFMLISNILHIFKIEFVLAEEVLCDIMLSTYVIAYNSVIIVSALNRTKNNVQQKKLQEELEDYEDTHMLLNVCKDEYKNEYNDVNDKNKNFVDYHNLIKKDTEAVAIGPLLAVQFTLTARLHGTYDTPFFTILLQLFAIRHYFKFLNLVRIILPEASKKCRHQILFQFSLDTTILYFLFVLLQTNASTDEVDFLFASCQTLFAAVLIGTILHTLQTRAKLNNNETYKTK